MLAGEEQEQCFIGAEEEVGVVIRIRTINDCTTSEILVLKITSGLVLNNTSGLVLNNTCQHCTSSLSCYNYSNAMIEGHSQV